jgi:hypothetical protein
MMMAWGQTMREAGSFQTGRAPSVPEAFCKPMRPIRIHRGSSRRPAFRAIFLSLLIGLTGCAKQPINPPRLIVDNDTDMTIQLFLQATILLSRAYGFEPMSFEEIQARTVRAGFKTIPLMMPDTIRATPELRARMISDHGPALEDYLANKVGTKSLIKYYIRTGLRASQLICRNYLTRLDEANAYLQFIKDEFGVAAGLASSALVLAGANATLKDSFLLGRSSIDQGFSAYEEFRFLNIDRQAARLMVEAAQAKLAEHYFKRAEEAALNDNSAAGGYTFSDAIDAVSVIEYQCTREGIRFLLNRSISNTPTNMAVDPATGTIVFKSTGAAVQDAVIDEQKMPAGQQGGAGTGLGGGSSQKTNGGNRGRQSGSGQQGSNQGRSSGQVCMPNDPRAQQANCALEACGQLPNNATPTQNKICNFIGSDATKAGNAVGVFEGALANPKIKNKLPADITLASLISTRGGGARDDPFEAARVEMLKDPTIPK